MKLTIKVNHDEVELTDFPTKIIINVLVGILKSLHGVDEIKTAEFVLSEE